MLHDDKGVNFSRRYKNVNVIHTTSQKIKVTKTSSKTR